MWTEPDIRKLRRSNVTAEAKALAQIMSVPKWTPIAELDREKKQYLLVCDARKDRRIIRALLWVPMRRRDEVNLPALPGHWEHVTQPWADEDPTHFMELPAMPDEMEDEG